MAQTAPDDVDELMNIQNVDSYFNDNGNHHEDNDEKYMILDTPTNHINDDDLLYDEENSKFKTCCYVSIIIILTPFIALSLILIIFLSHIMMTNIICSIISCLLIAISVSSLIKSMTNIVIYIYIAFIIRNLIHIFIIKQITFVYNKLRLFYNIITCLSLIVITVYYMETNNKNNEKHDIYHILILIMSSIILLCDLWMISSLTFQPNKLHNKYFEINEDLLSSNFQFVGKHSCKIELDDISLCIDEMKQIYGSCITRPISNRKKQLKNLLRLIEENKDMIIDAIKMDLGRPDLMCLAYEVYPLISDIKLFINNIDEWSSPQNMGLSLSTFPSTNYHITEPYGTIFVNGIWNFPFQLALSPIAGAIAAGNNVVIKPCNISNKSSQILCDLLHKYMDSRFVQCIGHTSIGNGDDRIITSKILENEFDLIFFTGSTNGGKYIMKEASKYLTPIVLELGGKNPCFIDETANITLAAKQIINARVINAGMQCISPEYVFITKNVLNEFIFQCKKYINKWYKLDNELNDDLGINQSKLINKDQLKRVCDLLSSTKGKILCGGNYDEETLMFEPTLVLLSDIKEIGNEPTIKTETFGPILWIIPISSNSIKDAVDFVNKEQEKSLSLYIFSGNRKIQNYIINNTSSGAIQINATITYSGNNKARFGGIGKSGIGCYHGKHSFDTFSHKKPVIRSWMENILVYPPYTSMSSWKKKIFSIAL